MLVRVLGWLVLLARSDVAKHAETLGRLDPGSRYCAARTPGRH